jgi:hypothetical protein
MSRPRRIALTALLIAGAVLLSPVCSPRAYDCIKYGNCPAEDAQGAGGGSW